MKSNASSIVSPIGQSETTRLLPELFVQSFFMRVFRAIRLGSWLTKKHWRNQIMIRSSNCTPSTARLWSRRTRRRSLLAQPPRLVQHISAHISSGAVSAFRQRNKLTPTPSNPFKYAWNRISNREEERQRRKRSQFDLKESCLKALGCASMQPNARRSK